MGGHVRDAKGCNSMADRPRFFDDLAGVAGGAISALTGLRQEAEAIVRARIDETIRALDLVRRDEYDALAEVAAARARRPGIRGNKGRGAGRTARGDRGAVDGTGNRAKRFGLGSPSLCLHGLSPRTYRGPCGAARHPYRLRSAANTKGIQNFSIPGRPWTTGRPWPSSGRETPYVGFSDYHSRYGR